MCDWKEKEDAQSGDFWNTDDTDLADKN